MKILSIQGSPNKNRNTATLLKNYLYGVEDTYPDAEVTEINLADKDIKGCIGCAHCRKNKGQCATKDDMQEIYPLLNECNAIVLATPVYFWNMTSQTKAFIDRWFALGLEPWKGKKLTLLTTYAGTDEENSGAIHIYNSVGSMCKFLGMEYVHKYGVSTNKVLISENEAAKEKAFELGKTL